MASFRMTAEIIVTGKDVRSEQDVKDEIVIMLGCYEDMSDTDTDIIIRPLITHEITSD